MCQHIFEIPPGKLVKAIQSEWMASFCAVEVDGRTMLSLHKYVCHTLLSRWVAITSSSNAAEQILHSSLELERRALSGTRAWVANPDNYASFQNIRFDRDGTGSIVFGHGQWIYTDIQFKYEIQSPGILHLTYLESPYPLNPDFSFHPTDANRTRTLHYAVRMERENGVSNVVATRFSYQRALVFEDSPYPGGLQLPYKSPSVFYGYPEK